MRSSGATSVRQWCRENVKESHRDYSDLWSLASNIDFLLGACTTSREVHQLLAGGSPGSDIVESAIRRLASHVYAERTGDTSGALHMLAVRASGSGEDVAPRWLVDSATTHCREEHRRAQRVATSSTDAQGAVHFWSNARGGSQAGRGSQSVGPTPDAAANIKGQSRGRSPGRGRQDRS